jgi:SAM-dependent methyltransferase
MTGFPQSDMVEPPGSYRFHPVDVCVMCGAPAAEARVLGLRLNRSQGMRPRSARGTAVTIVRCGQCRLIYPDPQPVPASIADHYAMDSENYFGGDERSVGETDHVRIALYRQLRGLLPAGSKPKAIDVGVGTGYSMRAMIETGFDVYGFEPVPQFRDQALAAMGLSEDRIALAGIDEAEFAPGGYDFVSFGAVLEHLYDPAKSLEKVLRWVRPGGIVYCDVPNADYLMSRVVNAFFALQRANLVTHLSPMHSPFHLYEFSRRSFERHGRRAGYELAQVNYEVGTVRDVPAFTRPLFRTIMRITNSGLMMHLALRKL